MYKTTDDEIKRIQKEYEVGEDIAEQAQELIDEGLDEDEAVKIAEEM